MLSMSRSLVVMKQLYVLIGTGLAGGVSGAASAAFTVAWLHGVVTCVRPRCGEGCRNGRLASGPCASFSPEPAESSGPPLRRFW